MWPPSFFLKYICLFFYPCISIFFCPFSTCSFSRSLSLCTSCSARQQSTNAPWHVPQLRVTVWPSFAQWPNGDLPSYHYAQAIYCTGAPFGAGMQAAGVAVRVEEEGDEEGRVLPLTSRIASTDSEMNGLRAEEAPKHFNTTCEIRCVKPYYRCDLYPHSCSANNVMYRMSRMLVEIKYLCTLTAFIEGVTGIIIDQCAKSIIYIYICTLFFFFLKQHLVMYKLKKTWHLIPNISLKSDRIPRKLIFKFPVALIFRCFLTFLHGRCV